MSAPVPAAAQYGFWTVAAILDPNGRRAICRCRCGTVRVVAVAELARGSSTSSGCSPSPTLAREALAYRAARALDGKVIGRGMQRHRHQEFIHFLNTIAAEVPVGKIVHVILDNYGPHKHPKTRVWLDRHPRFVFHYTPTSGS